MQFDISRFRLWIRHLVAITGQPVRDMAAVSLPQFVKALTGFVTSVWLTRGLGPAGLGQYALVLSVSDSVVGLSDLGIGQTAIRYSSLAWSRGELSRQAAVLRWAFRTRLTLVAFMVTVLYLAAPFLSSVVWHLQGLTSLIRIALLISVFGTLASVPIVYYQSLRRFEMNAIVQICQNLTSFLGIALLALLGLWSVPLVVAVTAIAAGVGAVIFLYLVPREIWWPRITTRVRPAIRWEAIWRIPRLEGGMQGNLDPTSADRFAVYLFLSTLIVLITLRLDIWLMGVYLDDRQIGLYNAATRLSLPLTVILGALTTALWPRVSTVTTVAGVRTLLRRTMKASVVIAAGGLVYALTVPFLVPVFFGPAYRDSMVLTQLVSIGYCVGLLANPVTVVGYSLGLARFYWITNLIQFAVVTVLLVLLLPRFGALAAAFTFIANAATGALINGFVLWMKTRQLPRDFDNDAPSDSQ